MKFTISKINRTVELNDELVQVYTEFKDIRENIFLISLYLKYHNFSTEMSDKELSDFCNKALLKDLENMRDNAIVVNYIENNKDKIFNSDWKEEDMEVVVG